MQRELPNDKKYLYNAKAKGIFVDEMLDLAHLSEGNPPYPAFKRNSQRNSREIFRATSRAILD